VAAPEFHRLAADEVAGAVHWYARRGPTLPRRLLLELGAALQQAERWPESFPIALEAAGLTYRKARLNRFPFAVIYRPTSTGIRVLALAHYKRRPLYWRRRA
jgi:hypothetical protein